jgi:hypothetical protein
MKRTKLAVIALLALLISVPTLSQVNLVSANYYPPPSIEIFSPIPAPDVHSTASVPLQVRVNVLTNEADITFIRYSLDGGANVTLTNLTREDGLYYWTTTKGVFAHGNAFSTEASLDNVEEGNHTLIVYSHAADGKEMSRTREFTVDYDYVPPQPQLTDSMNHTAATTNPMDPTGTAQPTTNTDSFQPLENPLPFIIIACIAVSLLGAGLYLRKKTRFSEIGERRKLS